MTKYKFTLGSPAEGGKVKAWLDAGRGIKLWVSHDLGAGRPEQLTPGDKGSPHWAYPEGVDISPDEIEVVDRTPVLPPPEWQPVCVRCNGVGSRTYASIAAIRKEDVETTRALLTAPDSHWAPYQLDDEKMTCNTCKGTGHDPFVMEIRVKRTFYGAVVPVSTAARYIGTDNCPMKVGKILGKMRKHYQLGAKLKWDFEVVDTGVAHVHFFTEKSMSLTAFIEQIKLTNEIVAELNAE